MQELMKTASEAVHAAAASTTAKVGVAASTTASGLSLWLGIFDASLSRIAACIGITISLFILRKTLLEIQELKAKIKKHAEKSKIE